MNAALPAALLSPADKRTTIGLARLTRMAYEGAALAPVRDALVQRIRRDPRDAAALMDLSMVLLLAGHRPEAMQTQRTALALSPLYRQPHGAGDGLKLLAFVVGGDFMANTPLDFLLEGSNVELHLLYVGAGAAVPETLPEHDLAFLAIGESAANRPVLEAMAGVLASWPRPVMNGAPLVAS